MGDNPSRDSVLRAGAHRQVLELALLHPDVPVSVDLLATEPFRPFGEILVKIVKEFCVKTNQSMLGSAITSRVKHLFLLRVPWCFRASALSFARSTFADTTLENIDTFPIKAAFLDAGCSFIGEASLETEFGMMGESLGDVILPDRDLKIKQ